MLFWRLCAFEQSWKKNPMILHCFDQSKSFNVLMWPNGSILFCFLHILPCHASLHTGGMWHMVINSSGGRGSPLWSCGMTFVHQAAEVLGLDVDPGVDPGVEDQHHKSLKFFVKELEPIQKNMQGHFYPMTWSGLLLINKSSFHIQS